MAGEKASVRRHAETSRMRLLVVRLGPAHLHAESLHLETLISVETPRAHHLEGTIQARYHAETIQARHHAETIQVSRRASRSSAHAALLQAAALATSPLPAPASHGPTQARPPPRLLPPATAGAKLPTWSRTVSIGVNGADIYVRAENETHSHLGAFGCKPSVQNAPSAGEKCEVQTLSSL